MRGVLLLLVSAGCNRVLGRAVVLTMMHRDCS
jgi:hypothetical protein